VHEEHVPQTLLPHFFSEDSELEGRGVAGRATEVLYTFDEDFLPLENPCFPFTNPTEVMLYLYKHCCQPKEEHYRMLTAIVHHPSFNAADWPNEERLHQLTHSLPLLPLYHVTVNGTQTWMHSVKDWMLQLERNGKLRGEMMWSPEFVSIFFLFIFGNIT
jgi:hypothetical protein